MKSIYVAFRVLQASSKYSLMNYKLRFLADLRLLKAASKMISMARKVKVYLRFWHGYWYIGCDRIRQACVFRVLQAS